MLAAGNFNDVTLSAGLLVYLGDWTGEFNINHSTMRDEAITVATYQKNNTWFGINLTGSY